MRVNFSCINDHQNVCVYAYEEKSHQETRDEVKSQKWHQQQRQKLSWPSGTKNEDRRNKRGKNDVKKI